MQEAVPTLFNETDMMYETTTGPSAAMLAGFGLYMLFVLVIYVLMIVQYGNCLPKLVGRVGIV